MQKIGLIPRDSRKLWPKNALADTLPQTRDQNAFSVVCFVADLWEENKKCENGQRIRHLAAFHVDMLAQQAKKDKTKSTDSKSEAISILKVGSQEDGTLKVTSKNEVE